MIQLNYRDSRPIYEQVKDGFRHLIIQKVMTKDEKLPSVREVARRAGGRELALYPKLRSAERLSPPPASQEPPRRGGLSAVAKLSQPPCEILSGGVQ